MNWKAEAVDKLRCYEAKRGSIARAREEMQRLESELTRIRSATSDATPVSGGGSTREDIMLNNIAHRRELELVIADAQAWCNIVNGGLSVLNDEERLILDRFYIHPARGNVGRLRDELGFSEDSSVYRRKEKALRHFTMALYGTIES